MWLKLLWDGFLHKKINKNQVILVFSKLKFKKRMYKTLFFFLWLFSMIRKKAISFKQNLI